jgi:SAM-dependent methyltransferase
MTTQPHTTDLAAIKGRQRHAWASGDYAAVATTTVIVSELLCEAAEVRPGRQVLDVATGSGNTALAAARRFCEVAGIDYVPALLERARERAAVEGLTIAFREGDAEEIPFADASFDVVLSTFGAMFAPDQEQVARELLRVCRPGGLIGMANWTPDSLAGAINRAISRHVPPPPGLRPPNAWGTEDRLQELFGKDIASLQATRRSFAFRYRTPAHWLEFFRAHYGPIQRAFVALDPARQEHLAQDLLAVMSGFNRSGDDTLVAPNDYLEVVAVKR